VGPTGPQTPALLLHCTAPLTLVQGLCYTALQPAAAWNVADVNCLNLGLMRLPGVGEDSVVIGDQQIRNGGGDENDWSDNDSGSGNATTVHITNFVVGFEDHPQSGAHTYRCVTPAHNNLGPTPTAPTRQGGNFHST